MERLSILSTEQRNKESTQRGKQGKKAHKGANKQKQAHKGANKHVIKKRGCPRRTNVGLDLISKVPLYWSTDDTCAIKQSFLKGLKISCMKTGANLHKIISRD